MGRAAKVQSFFESAMTDFTEQLHLYQEAPILGFKYNFIKHNTELFEIFKDEMKWNKPSHTH